MCSLSPKNLFVLTCIRKDLLSSSTPEPDEASPATPRKAEPRVSRKKLPAQRGNVWQRMCQHKDWASPVFAILLAILLWVPAASAQQQVFSVSGVLTLDLSKGNNSFKVLLSQAVTSVVFGTPQPGMNITVTFTENATGGFAVTFGGNVANACTVNMAANATTVCQFSYDASTNTINGVSGSGSGSGADTKALTLSTNCGGATNCFTVNANEIQIADGVTSGTTVTSASGGFAKAVAGMTIVGFSSCGVASGSGSTQVIGSTSSNPTIASVQSSTQITLSVAANVNQSNVCVDYGNLDDAGAAALDTVYTTLPYVTTINIPLSGRLMFASAHFNQSTPQPVTNCEPVVANSPSILGCTTIKGQGPATVIHWLPTVATGGSCATGTGSCIGGQKQTVIRDLTITGDGISYSSGGPASSTFGIILNCGALINVSLSFWGYQVTSINTPLLAGIESTCSPSISTDLLINVQNDGFGGIGLLGNGNWQAYNSFIADNCGLPVYLISVSGIFNGGLIGQNQCGAANRGVVQLNGGTLTLNGVTTYTASASQHGWDIESANTLTAINSTFGPSGAGTGLTALVLQNAGAKLNLRDSSVTFGAGSLCGGSGGTVSETDVANTGLGSACSFTTYTFKHSEQGQCVFAASTTCVVTFAQPFGSAATPAAVTITPYNPGAITFTISTPTATGFTITASGSNSLTVAWTAKL